MGKKKKMTESEREKIRKIKRECERKRRQRIKENPLLYEEHLQKEKERYKARVESGKIKTVSQMNEREKRAQRKKVREKVRKHREKKRRTDELNDMLNENSPPESDAEHPLPALNDNNHMANILPAVNNIPVVGRAGTSRKESGKRRAKKNKAKCYREIEKLKEKLNQSKKRGDKYKKKFFRLKEQVANKNSPRTKTRRFLRGENVSPRVKKRLEFSNVLSSQIQENYEMNKNSRKSLKAFSLVFSGRIVKKYKVVTQMKDYVGNYYKNLNKVSKGENIFETLKTMTNYSTKNIKIKRDVVQFFEQDDVSRLEPGKKDCITRLKVKKQKRFLTGSLSSLHKKFEVEYGYNVPYSMFCSFRPFWVLRANMKNRKTCLCEKHENIELIMKKLKDLKVINTNDSDGLVKALCCPPTEGKRTKEECLERKCQVCKNNQITINMFENKEIEIEQWKRKKETISIKGKEKKVTKVVKETSKETIKDVVQMLLNMIPTFMKHIFNIVHQYRAIYKLKQELKSNDVLIHIDFSENYVCKYAQEVQSVHFGGSHQQITLHTGVAYVKPTDKQIEIIPFCTLSESLKHDAPAIGAHVEKILTYLEEKNVKIENLHFLSDSPSTQYRNRHMFFLMKEYFRKFCSKSLTWNYSESGHGKGAPDGVGGTLKRTADRLVAEGRDLASFQSLISALKDQTKIDLFTVTGEEISKVEKLLKTDLVAFKGTMSCHQVSLSKDSTTLNMRKLSCFRCSAEAKCSHFHIGIYSAEPPNEDNSGSKKKRVRYTDVYSSESEDEPEAEPIAVNNQLENDRPIGIGDWVVVIYDDIWYPVLSLEPYHIFAIPVKSDDYDEDSGTGISCQLRFEYTPNYPEEPPVIEIEDTVGLEDDEEQTLRDHLQEQVDENLGMVMIFTLVSAAQEWLNSQSDMRRKIAEMREEKRIRDEEEAERKRFEGTRVTVESFLAWKKAFDLEFGINNKKVQDDKNKKLTGRELFLSDKSLNESDLKFLEVEGGEVVKVDESLFQDLDELDIEDEELRDDDG